MPSGINSGIKFGNCCAESVAYGNGTWVVVAEYSKASYHIVDSEASQIEATRIKESTIRIRGGKLRIK